MVTSVITVKGGLKRLWTLWQVAKRTVFKNRTAGVRFKRIMKQLGLNPSWTMNINHKQAKNLAGVYEYFFQIIEFKMQASSIRSWILGPDAITALYLYSTGRNGLSIQIKLRAWESKRFVGGRWWDRRFQCFTALTAKLLYLLKGFPALLE